jgi:hypothetical protein
MTTGIEGTGPYARLRDLRTQAKQYKYEITMLSPRPRRLASLKDALTEAKSQIAAINLEIKAGKAKK